ncbi:MAG TPA: tetratricopeptide repeat-containing sensor histidine kinase [Puia sp.]|nr:tetratricopeptide repeat-containing sensor histidine kinase [Puia sp.]
MACHKPTSLPPDHPAYFDRIYHQVDSMNLPCDRAFQFVDSVYAQFPSPGVIDRVRRFDYKGQWYFYQAHDLGNAMRYVDSSLLLLSGVEVQSRYRREYAKCLIDKAETYQFENNYENALLYYRKGLEAIQDLGDSCSMAEYTQRIAMASYRAGRFADARHLFELALHQFAACDKSDFRNFAYIQCNLDNIGESYASMRKWDSAAYYYDSTLSYIDRESGPFLDNSSHRAYIETARAVVYGNQGDYFLHRGDTTKALLLYQNSIAINVRPLHDSGNALVVLVKSARLQLARGHLRDANPALQEARAMLDRRPDADMDLAWQKLHAEALARSGDFSGAWRSLNALTNVKDSIYTAGTTSSSVDMPGALVHLEDRQTIQLLQQRDQVKTVYLALALLIVFMLVIIALLIRRGARRSNGHIQQLNALNKALRDENRQTQTAIKALNEDQAMYLRSLKTIAHDLRNPVGAISSAVSLLQQQEGLDSQSRTMLNLIRQSADQSLHLVGGIMNLDLPMGSLKMETVELEKLLETCVATLQFRAGEKKQTIRLEAEPVALPADHDKLWRVIINLLDNAIKFSPAGADIAIKLFRQDDKAIITVSDKGIGIPKGMEGKLFAVDGSAKRSGTAGEASFGLGLAIVSQIIKAHGGDISVQSEEHEGTTFRIELQVPAA